MDATKYGYRVDAPAGVVFGARGQPVGRMKNGYVQIHHRLFCVQAHRLIWECTNGPIPKGLEINHINGIKTDNRIANLELVTPSENMKHAYRIGLKSAKGAKNGRYKHGRFVGEKARAVIAEATGETP
jgi:hypothetical protein